MPQISIIIPVYNVEQYLRKCLDSILNQTFQDYEVICVNDGSTDNSLGILNDYASNDKRFIIISKDNEGVSVARNIGIEKAQGKYIQFVDGDDWLEPECLELTYNKIKDSDLDIIYYCHNNFKDGKKLFDNIDEANKFFVDNENKSFIVMIWTCWNKLISRDFLQKNNIRFPKNIHYAEDGIFNLMCLYHNPKTAFIDKALYNYLYLKENSTLLQHNAIELENKALDFIINTQEFLNANDKFKILVINKHCRGTFSAFNVLSQNNVKIRFKHLKIFISYLDKNIKSSLLSQCYDYKQLKNFSKKVCKNKFFDFFYRFF